LKGAGLPNLIDGDVSITRQEMHVSPSIIKEPVEVIPVDVAIEVGDS